MFGPLNGVRTGLVVAAALTGITAALLGQGTAAALLGTGVLVHGVGWWYLYQRRQSDGS